MSVLEDSIKQIVNEAVDARLASLPQPKVETKIDAKTLESYLQNSEIAALPNRQISKLQCFR